MIGKARQRHAIDRRVDQPARQILARRHQECGVIEPGRVAGFIGRARMRFKHQKFHAARAERCACGGALHHGQPDRVTIEIRNRIEPADADRHRADPHRRAVGKGRAAALPASLGTRRRRGSRRKGGSTGEVQQGAAGQVEIHGRLLCTSEQINLRSITFSIRCSCPLRRIQSHVRRSDRRDRSVRRQSLAASGRLLIGVVFQPTHEKAGAPHGLLEHGLRSPGHFARKMDVDGRRAIFRSRPSPKLVVHDLQYLEAKEDSVVYPRVQASD